MFKKRVKVFILIVTVTEKHIKEKNFKNLFGLLVPKITLEKRYFGKTIIFNYFLNKKVSEKYAFKFLKGNTKNILCSKNLKLLKYESFKRYVQSQKFTEDLCINAFLEVIKILFDSLKNISITLLDLDGNYCNLVDDLVLYCKNINVISNNLERYRKKQENILKNYGAPIIISSNVSNAFNSKLILAPKVINTYLPVKSNSVLFTSTKSIVPIKCMTFFGYKFPAIKKLKAVLPYDISQEYFLSAMCDLFNTRIFKKITPYYCINDTKKFTLKDVANQISKICDF